MWLEDRTLTAFTQSHNKATFTGLQHPLQDLHKTSSRIAHLIHSSLVHACGNHSHLLDRTTVWLSTRIVGHAAADVSQWPPKWANPLRRGIIRMFRKDGYSQRFRRGLSVLDFNEHIRGICGHLRYYSAVIWEYFQHHSFHRLLHDIIR